MWYPFSLIYFKKFIITPKLAMLCLFSACILYKVYHKPFNLQVCPSNPST